MKKAFTLIEMVVAIGILAIMVSFAGAVFNVSIESYRLATANTEIMQKLRAITDQLNADFSGLRKDGEIFVVWVPSPVDEDNDGTVDYYERLDRIMFFANGDFHTYHQWNGNIRGNVARICYMLANRRAANPADPPIKAQGQTRRTRILARTQHILTADTRAGVLPNLATPIEDELRLWHNLNETEINTLDEWQNMLWDPDKRIALSVITDVDVDSSGLGGGALVEPAEANSIHMLLCEGVGEFMIQGWHDDLGRWVPEVAEGDCALPAPYIPGVLYPLNRRQSSDPNDWYGAVVLGGVFAQGQPYEFPPGHLNQEHFNEIPGLGRALRFTFTLYDSRAIITEGRTFSHIVYLDE